MDILSAFTDVAMLILKVKKPVLNLRILFIEVVVLKLTQRKIKPKKKKKKRLATTKWTSMNHLIEKQTKEK